MGASLVAKCKESTWKCRRRVVQCLLDHWSSVHGYLIQLTVGSMQVSKMGQCSLSLAENVPRHDPNAAS